MSDKIEVTATPESLVTTAGETVETSATLHNLGQSIDQFTITIEGLDASWYTLPVSSVALFPNDKDNLKILLSPPKTPETKAGSYPFRIRVASQADPKEAATVDLNIEIQALPELELSISPPRITGRRGVYQILVNNPGDSEAKLHLEASDAQGTLRYDLQPEDLTVSGKSRAQSTLEVSLGWMALFGGEKELDFQVLATLSEAEEGKTVDGQLVRIPWYRILTRMRLPRVQSIDGQLARIPWYRSIRLIRLPRIRLPRIRLPWLEKPPVINTFRAISDDRIEFKLSWLVKRSRIVKLNVVKLNGEVVDRQGERVVLPTSPTSYSLTASNRYGSSSKTVEVQPRLVPKAQTSELVKASLSSTELQLQAGVMPETVIVQLRNQAEIVDKFLVEVDGIDDAWYSRSASSVALMPQATEQVQITFQVPKKKGVKARPYPFAVTVRSQSNPDEATIITGQIEVLPLVEYKLKVAPYRVSTRKKGKFRVNLANTGMSDAKLYLEASDLDEGLRFKFKKEELVVAAWETIEVLMIARPKRGSTIGERRRYDISITATTEDGNTQTVNCELHHNPSMSSWRPIWRLIKILILLGLISVGIYYILPLGGGWRMLSSSPETWLSQLIRVVQRFIEGFIYRVS
ncbi:hypothetical protein ACFLVX_01495 [Chloroflexota bacterium]